VPTRANLEIDARIEAEHQNRSARGKSSMFATKCEAQPGQSLHRM
jgi:hypothetical protein